MLQLQDDSTSSDILICRLTASQHPHYSSPAVKAHTLEHSDNPNPLAQPPPPPPPRHSLLFHINLDAPALPATPSMSAAQTNVAYLFRGPALAAAVAAPADDGVAGSDACGCTHSDCSS